jgi:hypothetical protein
MLRKIGEVLRRARQRWNRRTTAEIIQQVAEGVATKRSQVELAE